MMTVQPGGVEKVKAELEKEEGELVRLKEATQQQLKVLQAEAITIQRLLHAHSQQLRGNRSETQPGEELFHTEPPPDQLPELNLDLEPNSRSPVSEEEEEEMEEEEEEDTG